jgi:Zn-dependent protease
MSLVWFPVYAIGFLFFIKLLQYALVVKALLTLRYKQAGGELRDRGSVPIYLDKLFGVSEQQLAGLGFDFYHCQIFDELVISERSRRWNVIYFNRSNKCYANISTSPLPQPEDPVRVEFVSIFSDGSRLVTVNGVSHYVLGEIPNVTLLDPYAETVEKQYQTHLEKLTELIQQKIPVVLGQAEYLASEIEAANAYLGSLRARGLIRQTDEGLMRLLTIPACLQAYKALKGMRKAKQLSVKRQKLSKTYKLALPEIPLEVEVDAFERALEISKSRDKSIGIGGKVLVFVVSLLLFSMVFGFTLSLEILLILIVVLFIHELGHFLGMVLFGFSDRQILFLPFVGAATTGSKRQATPLQRVIVYLLGPAPGILLGVACIVVFRNTHAEFFLQAGVLLLLLNYLNLLPIVPLDGGRVLEVALFSRISFLKTAFVILSTAVFWVGTVFIRDPILFVISLFLTIGLRSQIHQDLVLSKLNKTMRLEHLEVTDDVIIPVIFRILKNERFNKLPFARKFRVAKYLLDNSMQKPPTIWVTLLSLLLYVVVILLPISIIVTVAILAVFLGY